MAVWKVSYVVVNSKHPGGILNVDHPPTVGEVIELGHNQLEVLEVFELMPPRREFHYIHVTCQLVEASE